MVFDGPGLGRPGTDATRENLNSIQEVFMNLSMLILVFLAAVAVAGCVTRIFAEPMDWALMRLINHEMAAAWSRFAKFAVFVASFTGGLRLNELQSLTTFGSGQAPVNWSQGLLEVYKTISGGLTAASYTLLIFFGATLIAYAATQVYDYLKQVGKPGRSEEHRGVPAGRY